MINGKIYKEATISRVEADGIALRTKTGIYKIYFVASQRHPGPFSLQSSDANRSSARAYADQGRNKTGRLLAGLTRAAGQGASNCGSFPKISDSGDSNHQRRTVRYSS